MFEIGINSIADWCSSAEEAISPHELRVLTAAQITSSLQALDFRMAAANVMHRAGEWLVSTASGASTSAWEILDRVTTRFVPNCTNETSAVSEPLAPTKSIARAGWPANNIIRTAKPPLQARKL